LSLAALINEPFKLLLAIEQRAKDAIAKRQGTSDTVEEWIGVAFRLGNERFVTARADVREVLPLPDQQTRVPGTKPWLRGIANVRGQLLTIVDLKAFLGAGPMHADRKARMLLLASREVPTAVIVDEVLGFRRFATAEFSEPAPVTEIRCEHYLAGSFRREAESIPLFDMQRLLKDPSFLNAGALKAEAREASRR
jgi:twitching motility protein PilI